MYKKYKFDIKSYNKINLWKLILLLLLILIYARTYITALGYGVLVLGVYAVKLMLWKSAYIEIYDGHLNYYRKVSNLMWYDDVSHEFGNKLALIHSISQIYIRNNKITINGNIEIYYKKRHDENNKKVNSIKIPLYFEKKDEIIENISKYIVK